MSFENCGTELPLANVHITSAFWLARLQATKNGALPAMYEQMKKTGRWDCLKLKWKPGEPNKPCVPEDLHVYRAHVKGIGIAFGKSTWVFESSKGQ
jgi:hypothetical protein